MALTTLTGQNIQDTYQKVVQTDGTNLADGTGSLLPISIDGNDVTISGSLTANEYIVSSSVTNITVATLSGSTDFGDDTGDTHKFTGSLFISGTYVGINNDNPNYMLDVGGDIHTTNVLRTSGLYSTFGSFTGNINANGNIVGDNGTNISGINTFNCVGNATLGNASSDAHTINGTLSANNKIFTSTIVEAPTGSFKKLKGDTTLATGLFVNGTITASSHISSSGDIYASTLNAGEFLGIVATAAQPQITSVGTLTSITSTGNSILGNAITDTHTFEGHITASGNISSSGTVTAKKLQIEDLSAIYRNNADGLNFGQSATRLSINVANITASGNISASGIINTQQLNLGNQHYGDFNGTLFRVGASAPSNHLTDFEVSDGTGNSVFLDASSGQITASGNISSSGDLFLSSSINFGGSGSINFDGGITIKDTSEDESIEIRDETIKFKAGGTTALQIRDANNDILLGYSGIDAVWCGSGGNQLWKTDMLNARTDMVRRIRMAPSHSFTDDDGLSRLYVSGSTNLDGNVTASGNISSSGNIYAKDYFDDGININTLYDLTPTGTISSSAQLPSGILSSSAQLPAGVISSSLQNLGNITGSTISSSGDIIAPNIYLDAGGVIDFTNVSGQTQYISGTDNNITIDGDNYVNIYSDIGTLIRGGGYLHAYDYIKTDSYISASGYLTAQHITASGNISASGTIQSLTGSFNELLIASSSNRIYGHYDSGLSEQDLIISASDNDLKLMSGDDISIRPKNSVKMTTGNGNDEGLIVKDQSGKELLTVYSDGNGEIATSGNITATGTVAGSNLSGTNTGDQTNVAGTSATVTGATQASITTCANLTTIGTVTTGNVSAILPSGTMSGSAQLPSGTVSGSAQIADVTLTTAAQGNITSVGILTSLTSSGDISSSLASTGSFGRVEATNVHASGYIIAKTPVIVLNTTDNTTDMYVAYNATPDGSGGTLAIALGGTQIPWDKQEIIDTSFFTHSTSTNNERIYVTYAGRYEIMFSLTYNKDSARACPVVKPYTNGQWGDFRFQTNPMYQRASGGQNNASLNGSYIMELDAGDYFSLASGHVANFGNTPSGGGMKLTQYNSTHGFSKLMIKMIG